MSWLCCYICKYKLYCLVSLALFHAFKYVEEMITICVRNLPITFIEENSIEQNSCIDRDSIIRCQHSVEGDRVLK